METFPRKGVELSANCEMRFPSGSQIRPSIDSRFGDGSRSSRFTTSKAIFTFVVTFKGASDDFGTVMDFHAAHGKVVAFLLVHPDFGTGTAFFDTAKLPFEKIVGGNPPWFRIEIPVEAVF